MNLSRRQWLPWVSVSVLAVSCATLGYLQYRWTGQITEAERTSLYEGLRSHLATFTRTFNDEISQALSALQPSSGQIETRGRDAAYAEEYSRWAQTHGAFFRRIALAVPRADGDLSLLNLDMAKAHFSAGEWPASWEPMRDRLSRILESGGMGPPRPDEGTLLELPRFDGRREQEWLLVELNEEFLRANVLPELLNRYLAEAGHVDYDIDVIGDRGRVVYSSLPLHAAVVDTNADATASLLDIRSGRGPGRQGFGRGPGPGPPGDRGPGRWRMLVRHRAGSLEALVTQTRRRNLAISAAVLLLILSTVSMLVRLSRQAQKLAELQLGFVAGVSHELKTPLTVIRTCAYNLRSPAFRNRTDQVERYGQLIEAETAKLEGLVEQVLRFASAEAGHAVRDRAPLAIGRIIGEELDARREALEERNVVVDERIADDLPLVLADESALRHVLQNLFDNALKYGTSGRPGSNWIGVYAEATIRGQTRFAEIRVADRGPGIPADEQSQIFDAFYRGRRAVEDQVHGTGLGLSLVKKIVDAHGGSVHVMSGPASGTEFIVRLPEATQA